ncbi:MAG: formyltransferase family protein [Patescibacteria group bacterium]|jgi:methionyl-tRNA formyltransferase
MIRIAYFGYRSWAIQILNQLIKEIDPNKSSVVYIGIVKYDAGAKIDPNQYQNLHFVDPKNKEELFKIIKENKINLALFYGWSWLVPKEILAAVDCLCLHPSLLPAYRGGTPWQHQIINGESEGGLTIFKMAEGIDAGPILKQRGFSLAGRLADLFQRLAANGGAATLEVIRDYEAGQVKFIEQKDLDQYPARQRFDWRKCEVKFEALANYLVKDFYNFVRALDDPYPNCFIPLNQGKKFLIKEVEIIADLPSGARVFDGSIGSLAAGDGVYLRLWDGQVRVCRYFIEN